MLKMIDLVVSPGHLNWILSQKFKKKKKKKKKEEEKGHLTNSYLVVPGSSPLKKKKANFSQKFLSVTFYWYHVVYAKSFIV